MFAVPTCIFSIRAEMKITSPICAIMIPKNKNMLLNIRCIIVSVEYTKYAVTAVINNATNILKKTRDKHELTAALSSASFCQVFDNTLSIKLLFGLLLNNKITPV